MERISKTKQTNMERVDKASLLEVISESSVKLNGNLLHIKKHLDRTILIYDENDNVSYDPVLPTLREINTENRLMVDLNYPNSSEKNTRDFGKDLINKLNEKTL
ncbi:hypothetical protein [Polaribacter ponticola]|uniref:Uncharacterized protein n=1 Tax=Polaribacter ponticola TaxID=2978475 RepID=A0ABT5SB93_9FLAO|nr:hypothetical protein [Polaribacter sp. MSW5]MDD7914567.1 hypothetical protein [Polaribacter sp. MSW5]